MGLLHGRLYFRHLGDATMEFGESGPSGLYGPSLALHRSSVSALPDEKPDSGARVDLKSVKMPVKHPAFFICYPVISPSKAHRSCPWLSTRPLFWRLRCGMPRPCPRAVALRARSNQFRFAVPMISEARVFFRGMETARYFHYLGFRNSSARNREKNNLPWNSTIRGNDTCLDGFRIYIVRNANT